MFLRTVGELRLKTSRDSISLKNVNKLDGGWGLRRKTSEYNGSLLSNSRIGWELVIVVSSDSLL